MSVRCAVVLPGLAILLSGCSSQPYESDYAERLATYRQDAVFATLGRDPLEFADGRVRFRMPAMLGTPKQDDGTKIRAKPPFLLNYPGFVAAYESIMLVGNAQMPEVLTVGIVPTTVQRHPEIEKSILEQVRRDESFSKADWSRGREVASASGAAVWDVLELDGPQEFEIVTGNMPEYKRVPGHAEVWVSADPRQEFCTILTLRAPEEVAAQLPEPVSTSIELTARTVEIVPAPVDPAADPPPK